MKSIKFKFLGPSLKVCIYRNKKYRIRKILYKTKRVIISTTIKIHCYHIYFTVNNGRQNYTLRKFPEQGISLHIRFARKVTLHIRLDFLIITTHATYKISKISPRRYYLCFAKTIVCGKLHCNRLSYFQDIAFISLSY